MRIGEPSMNRKEFSRNLTDAVDEAMSKELSEHTIEDVLQSEAQNVREGRRVYSVFVYECPEADCEESNTQLIDQMGLQCDVCDISLTLTHSYSTGDTKQMVFECENHATNHATTRIHGLDHEDIICSIHNKRMKLLESYTTKEGLGN